jgi:hypothetical protein
MTIQWISLVTGTFHRNRVPIKRGARGRLCADVMKTLALLCVAGLVAASDAFSGRIAIYGESTLLDTLCCKAL